MGRSSTSPAGSRSPTGGSARRSPALLTAEQIPGAFEGRQSPSGQTGGLSATDSASRGLACFRRRRDPGLRSPRTPDPDRSAGSVSGRGAGQSARGVPCGPGEAGCRARLAGCWGSAWFVRPGGVRRMRRGADYRQPPARLGATSPGARRAGECVSAARRSSASDSRRTRVVLRIRGPPADMRMSA
jgi:hypothetical protein